MSDASEHNNQIADAIFIPENLIHPEELWKQMRAQCPVAKIRTHTGGSGYVITRKDDLEYVSQHPEFFSSELDETVQRWGNSLGPEFKDILAKGYQPVHTIVTADPPRSFFYRALTVEALSPKRVAAREPAIRKLVQDLIDALPQNGETVDFRMAFAVPLPMSVILDVYGLPQEDADFVYWFTCECLSLFDPVTDIEVAKRNAEGLVKAQHYIAPRIEEYRKQPADNFLSFIANAKKDDGEFLSMEEALSMSLITLLGGNETTRNAIIIAARILALDFGLWQKLQADKSLIPAFVEEVVRLGAPATMTARQAIQDCALNGASIPKGAPLYLIWGSGSRDERFFDNPDAVKLDREKARYHTSFGSGVHHCAGVHLARKELILAIEGLLDAFERIELAVPPEEADFEPRFTIRTIEKLPLRMIRKSA